MKCFCYKDGAYTGSIKPDLKVKILEHFVITEKYIFGFESMKINKIVDPIRRERKEFSSLEIKKYLYVLCLIFYGLWVIGLGFTITKGKIILQYVKTDLCDPDLKS